MFNVFGRVAAGVAAGAALTLAAVAPAMADPGGATVTHLDNYCFDAAPYVGCISGVETENLVTTGNGSVVYHDNYKNTEKIYLNGVLVNGVLISGDLIETDHFKGHEQGVAKDMATYQQEEHYAYTDNVTFPNGTSCTGAVSFHYANGQVQFDRGVDTCH